MHWLGERAVARRIPRREPDPLLARLVERDAEFAGSHRTREKNTHRHPRTVSLANIVGDGQQIFFDLFHSADDFKTVFGRDEFDQPETFAFDDFALAFGD